MWRSWATVSLVLLSFHPVFVALGCGPGLQRRARPLGLLAARAPSLTPLASPCAACCAALRCAVQIPTSLSCATRWAPKTCACSPACAPVRPPRAGGRAGQPLLCCTARVVLHVAGRQAAARPACGAAGAAIAFKPCADGLHPRLERCCKGGGRGTCPPLPAPPAPPPIHQAPPHPSLPAVDHTFAKPTPRTRNPLLRAWQWWCAYLLPGACCTARVLQPGWRCRGAPVCPLRRTLHDMPRFE